MYELIPGHQFRTRVVQECVLLFVVLVFYLKYLTRRQRYRLFLGTIRKLFPFARGLHEKGTGGPSFDQRWYRMKVIYLLFLCFASLLLQKLHFLSPSTLALNNTLSMLLLLLLAAGMPLAFSNRPVSFCYHSHPHAHRPGWGSASHCFDQPGCLTIASY